MNEPFLCGIKLSKPLPKDSYLCDIPAIEWLCGSGELSFSSAVTFFVGENGSGKSTLLEAIAVSMGFNPEGGSKNYRFSTADTHSPLSELLTTVKSAFRPSDGYFLRAESLYNSATYLDSLPQGGIRYGERTLHEQSHGESFLTIIEQRFRGNGLYLLDEPEAALSPARLLRLLWDIHSLVSDGSQFIIATHSPILMAYPDAEILRFSDTGIERTEYRQTEHYQITKQFLDNPQRMLDIIFGSRPE